MGSVVISDNIRHKCEKLGEGKIRYTSSGKISPRFYDKKKQSKKIIDERRKVISIITVTFS